MDHLIIGQCITGLIVAWIATNKFIKMTDELNRISDAVQSIQNAQSDWYVEYYRGKDGEEEETPCESSSTPS